MSRACTYCPCWAYLLHVDVDCLKRGYGSINWAPELSACRMKLRGRQINLDSLLLFDLFNRFLKRHLEPHRGGGTSHPSSTSSRRHTSPWSSQPPCTWTSWWAYEWDFLEHTLGLLFSAEPGSFIQLVLRVWGHDSTSDPFGGKIWSGISFQGLSHWSVKSSFCRCPLELLTLASNSLGFHLSLAINMSPCWGETQSGIKFTAYKI